MRIRKKGQDAERFLAGDVFFFVFCFSPFSDTTEIQSQRDCERFAADWHRTFPIHSTRGAFAAYVFDLSVTIMRSRTTETQPLRTAPIGAEIRTNIRNR